MMLMKAHQKRTVIQVYTFYIYRILRLKDSTDYNHTYRANKVVIKSTALPLHSSGGRPIHALVPIHTYPQFS